MEPADVRRAVEVLIFASEGPAKLASLQRALPSLSAAGLRECVAEINEDLAKSERPYEIVPIAGGFQFRSRLEHAPLLQQAQPERKVRLSRAALETLAVIAYRQPVTRADVEELRGVDSGAVVRGLLDRSLVRIVGRREAPGRPVLYGTSQAFLEVFGLESLRDLPALREVVADDVDLGTPAPLALAEPDAGAARGSEASDAPVEVETEPV